MASLTVRDLRVGAMSFDICFERKGDTTDFTVLDGPSDAVIRRAMTDWAEQLRGSS
jgi:hypothetical protein